RDAGDPKECCCRSQRSQRRLHAFLERSPDRFLSGRVFGGQIPRMHSGVPTGDVEERERSRSRGVPPPPTGRRSADASVPSFGIAGTETDPTPTTVRTSTPPESWVF